MTGSGHSRGPRAWQHQRRPEVTLWEVGAQRPAPTQNTCLRGSPPNTLHLPDPHVPAAPPPTQAPHGRQLGQRPHPLQEEEEGSSRAVFSAAGGQGLRGTVLLCSGGWSLGHQPALWSPSLSFCLCPADA